MEQIEDEHDKRGELLSRRTVEKYLRSALAMRAPCNSGRARLPCGVLSQSSLFELLDLGVLVRGHRLNQLLNRRNVQLANLHQLHARKKVAMLECAKGSVFKGN